MKKFILSITILTVLFGNCFAANSVEFQLAKDYFAANNFIFSSMYAEKGILTETLSKPDMNDLTVIFVESKKELGELSYAAEFLKKNQDKLSKEQIQNSESYLFEQNIYKNEFGGRVEKYVSLKKKDHLPAEEIKELAHFKEISEFDGQNKKKPWVAATMSGIIPGAGQVYNGNYQAAAVSFVFNALLLLSAIEFHHQDLEWPAVTSGFLFSMTYVGNIISSGRDAKAYNNLVNTPRNHLLKKDMLPELSLSFNF